PKAAAPVRGGFRQAGGGPVGDGFAAVRVGEKPYLAVSFFNPNQKAPTSYQSNIDLQHQLDSGLVVEVGYIGNEGRHLTGPDMTLNQVPADRITSGNTQVARPFPQF